eukprot:gene19798-19698_t
MKKAVEDAGFFVASLQLGVKMDDVPVKNDAHVTLGYQAGLVATQLLHKVALSATGYYEYATDNFGNNEMPTGQPRQALNYILSAGKLMLPRQYKNYNQTNVNLMLEVIGQELPETNQ